MVEQRLESLPNNRYFKAAGLPKPTILGSSSLQVAAEQGSDYAFASPIEYDQADASKLYTSSAKNDKKADLLASYLDFSRSNQG